MTDIWQDAEVRHIYEIQDGQPQLLLGDLDEGNQRLLLDFIEADSAASGQSPPEAIVRALVAGIRAVELLDVHPESLCNGFKKFVIYMTACNVQILWNEQLLAEESAIFGDWVVHTLGAHGWGPDGYGTALGSAYSNTMAVASQAGGGVQMNPQTGRFEASDGSAARSYSL